MPFTNAVAVAKADPPVEAAYHCILLPLAVKLATVAETQNDWALAVGAAGIGFTVIVNTWAVPAQPGILAIKLPKEAGTEPTATVATTVLVVLLIIETLFEPAFATYTLPSG